MPILRLNLLTRWIELLLNQLGGGSALGDHQGHCLPVILLHLRQVLFELVLLLMCLVQLLLAFIQLLLLPVSSLHLLLTLQLKLLPIHLHLLPVVLRRSQLERDLFLLLHDRLELTLSLLELIDLRFKLLFRRNLLALHIWNLFQLLTAILLEQWYLIFKPLDFILIDLIRLRLQLLLISELALIRSAWLLELLNSLLEFTYLVLVALFLAC